MMTRDSEVPSSVVKLDQALPPATGRQLPAEENLDSGSAGRYLRIAVDLVDDFLRPRGNHSVIGIAAIV
jgi:hypothetical protein